MAPPTPSPVARRVRSSATTSTEKPTAWAIFSNAVEVGRDVAGNSAASADITGAAAARTSGCTNATESTSAVNARASSTPLRHRPRRAILPRETIRSAAQAMPSAPRAYR